ncbi:MAG TPA: SGNH/GDSL hydrolase family protein [Blastocatellia bacterium]|nr:SGNH/GDSL hydrolase family protein [Blastocatellia bacterium]
MFTASNRQLKNRLSVIAATIALAALLIMSNASAFNGRDHDGRDDNWVATWGASSQSGAEPIFGPAPTPLQFNDQTIRLIARISKGGDRIRINLENRFGTDSLVIGAAHLARREAGAEIEPGSDRTLKFGGNPGITIPPGASVVSDPVRLHAPDLTELAVSLYLPKPTPALSVHSLGVQTAYLSSEGAGDLSGATTIPAPTTTLARYFLSGIEVRADDETKAIITLGDSITDGFNSTVDANRRWPDRLAERLRDQKQRQNLSVVNQGISGNRLLHNVIGPNVLSRFNHDVLAQTNAAFVVVLVGINDIGFSAIQNPDSPFTVQAVSAREMIQAYRQLISRAHAKGLRIIGGTLLPFEGAGYFSPEGETKRQAVNEFIRHSGEFDEVIDFDRATRDPNQLTRLLPLYDSGDHLHPNDAGYEAMANAVNLRVFNLR